MNSYKIEIVFENEALNNRERILRAVIAAQKKKISKQKKQISYFKKRQKLIKEENKNIIKKLAIKTENIDRHENFHKTLEKSFKNKESCEFCFGPFYRPKTFNLNCGCAVRKSCFLDRDDRIDNNSCTGCLAPINIARFNLSRLIILLIFVIRLFCDFQKFANL